MRSKKCILPITAILIASLAACAKGGGETEAAAEGEFQKNLHQTEKMSFLETDEGYYFTYSSLYFIDRDTMRAAHVCAKPDCDHSDDAICNARIHADYMLTGGERIYYVGYENYPKTVSSVKYDATERETVQELKFNEFSSSQSSWDRAIYHRGYIYYISDDVLYRVKLGGEKDSAEEIWRPENAGSTQAYGNMVQFNPNAIRYTLWAEGEAVYFMANVQTEDGTYRDALFEVDLDSLDVRKVWVTPGADEVGQWDRTGVSVSQWYVTGGYIYFYLSGGDMWRTELESGKSEKLADTHEKSQYGSAVFSDDYMCLLGELPADFYGQVTSDGSFRTPGGSIFLYGLDGEFKKEISIEPLLDTLDGSPSIDMLMCDSTDVYFLVTTTVYSTQYGFPVGNTNSITLCRANFDTGEASVVYKLR